MDGIHHRYESRRVGVHDYAHFAPGPSFSSLQVPSSYPARRRIGQRREGRAETTDRRAFRHRTGSEAVMMGSSEDYRHSSHRRHLERGGHRGSPNGRINPALDITPDTSSSTSSSHADNVGLIQSTKHSVVRPDRRTSSPRSRIARLRMVANGYHGLEDSGEIDSIQRKGYAMKEVPSASSEQFSKHGNFRPPKLISGDAVDTTLNTTSSLSSGTPPGNRQREAPESNGNDADIYPSLNQLKGKNRLSAVDTDGNHPFPTIRRRNLERAAASRRDDQETVASDSPSSKDGGGRVDGYIGASSHADESDNHFHGISRSTQAGLGPNHNLGGMMTMATTNHSRSMRIAAAAVTTSTAGASHHRSSWRSGHNLQYVPPVTPGVPPPPQPSNSRISAVQPVELARSPRIRKTKVSSNAAFTINKGHHAKNHHASAEEQTKSLWRRTSDDEEPFDVQSETLENTPVAHRRTPGHRRSGSSPAHASDRDDSLKTSTAEEAEDPRKRRNGVYAPGSLRPGDGLMLGKLQGSDFKPRTTRENQSTHRAVPGSMVFSTRQTQPSIAPIPVTPDAAPMDELEGDTTHSQDSADNNDSGPGRIVIGGGNNAPRLGPLGGRYPQFRPSHLQDSEESLERDRSGGLRGTGFTPEDSHSESSKKRGIHVLLDDRQIDPDHDVTNDDLAGNTGFLAEDTGFAELEEATFAEDSVTVMDGDNTIEVSVGSSEPSPIRPARNRTAQAMPQRNASRSRDPPEGPRDHAVHIVDHQLLPPTPTPQFLAEESSIARDKPMASEEEANIEESPQPSFERDELIRGEDEKRFHDVVQVPLTFTAQSGNRPGPVEGIHDGRRNPQKPLVTKPISVARTIVHEPKQQRAPTRAIDTVRGTPSTAATDAEHPRIAEPQDRYSERHSASNKRQPPDVGTSHEVTAEPKPCRNASPAPPSKAQSQRTSSRRRQSEFKRGLITDIEQMNKAVESEARSSPTILIDRGASPVENVIAIVEPFPSPDDRKANRQTNSAVDEDDESWKRAEEEWRLAEEAELEYHLTPLEEQEDDTLLDGQQLPSDTLSSPNVQLDSMTTDRGAPPGADLSLMASEGLASYDEHSPSKTTRQPKSILKRSASSSSSPSLRPQNRPEQSQQQPINTDENLKTASFESSAAKSDDEDSIFVFSDDDEGGVRNSSTKMHNSRNGHNSKLSTPEKGARKSGTIGGGEKTSLFRAAGSPLKSSLKSNPENENEADGSPRSTDSAAHRAPTLFRSRRKGHNNAMVAANDDDDDTSLENYGGHAKEKRGLNLQARTQQAWSVRNKVVNAQTSNYDPTVVGRTPDRTTTGRNGEEERTPSVAFAGADKNIVHHFHVPESDGSESTEVTQNSSPRACTEKFLDSNNHSGAYSDDDTATSNRSSVSGYSRTPVSDIEDFVKDLFFIGSGRKTYPRRRRRARSVEGRPSRRMVRVLPNSKKEMGLRCCVRTTQSPLTIPHASSTTDDSTKLKSSQEVFETNDDEFTSPDEHVNGEGGVGGETSEKVVAAVSIKSPRLPRGDESSPDSDNDIDSKVLPKDRGADADTASADPFSLVWSAVEDGVSVVGSAFGFRERNRTVSSSKQATNDDEESWVSMKSDSPPRSGKEVDEGWMDYASDLLLGPPEYKGANAPEVPHEAPQLTLSNQSENAEADLYELAKCAARAKHEINGLVFDESELDVVHDLKFSVITVALPLGLLFQENSSGCWVARVFETGNAANAKGDGVEVGDQIAAINGTSATKMRAEEVCRVISSAPNPTEIELTFLRFVGSLRPMPGSIDQEGYEVGLKRQPLSRRLSPARLFSQAKKKPDTPEPKKLLETPPGPKTPKMQIPTKASEVQGSLPFESKTPRIENQDSTGETTAKTQDQPKSAETTRALKRTLQKSPVETSARPKPQPPRPQQQAELISPTKPKLQQAPSTGPSTSETADDSKQGLKKAKKRFSFFGRSKK